MLPSLLCGRVFADERVCSADLGVEVNQLIDVVEAARPVYAPCLAFEVTLQVGSHRLDVAQRIQRLRGARRVAQGFGDTHGFAGAAYRVEQLSLTSAFAPGPPEECLGCQEGCTLQRVALP